MLVDLLLVVSLLSSATTTEAGVKKTRTFLGAGEEQIKKKEWHKRQQEQPHQKVNFFEPFVDKLPFEFFTFVSHLFLFLLG